MQKIICSLLLCFVCFLSARAQSDWSLKTDKEGIKVYTRNLENSPYKAVKTVCTVDATLSRLAAVLLDINTCKEWVYSTKSCRILQHLSPSELIYYSEISIPWPVSNRDFIVHLKVTQDPHTKVVTVDGYNKPNQLPVYKKIVRIQHAFSRWIITPLANGKLHIEYELQVNPGGSIPAWLINMFAAKGPFETFQKLREHLKKPAYNNVQLPFIKD